LEPESSFVAVKYCDKKLVVVAKHVRLVQKNHLKLI